MSYEGYFRKGTSRERKARALQLNTQLAERIVEAEKSSVLADKLNHIEGHVCAAKAWRRVIYPASRLGEDTTKAREAVRRHMDAADSIRKSQT